MSLRAKLGYTAAALTMLLASFVPFVLLGAFTNAFASLGLHVDEVYSGGPKLRSIQTSAYSIDIHRPVYPHFLQTENPFVQLDWRPATSLPSHVSDTVDIDGDGQPDVRVTFDVPTNRKVPLSVDVESLNPHYQSMRNVGKQKYSRLIVRVDDAILVRIPLAQP